MYDYRQMPNYPGSSSGAGSSFLTGVGSAFGGGLGGAVGGLLGGALGIGQTSNRTKVKFSGELADEAWNAAMRNAKKFGIHPLYALGNAPSSAGSGGYDLTDHTLGSAITEGVRFARETGRNNAERAAIRENQNNARILQRLKLTEQGLRNEWLHEQIEHQKLKRMQQALNARQDVVKIGALTGLSSGDLSLAGGYRDKLVTMSPPPEHIAPDSNVTMVGTMPVEARPGTATNEAIQDRYGELGGLLYSLYQIPATIGYNLDKQIEKLGSGKGSGWANDPFGYDYEY